MTDETLKILLQGSNARPLEALEESDGQWHLNTFSILKHRPSFHTGFGYALRSESCFYKRWFDFPDIGKRGWALMFHAYDPPPDQASALGTEHFPGWVPPERVRDADTWIDFLNGQVRARLTEANAGAQPRK